MVKVHISEIISSIESSNIVWLIIPIFFIGIVTDKYQEEFGTSIGNAISNGALIIFTGFSWLQIIFSRDYLPADIVLSQLIFTTFIIVYGFSIIASGFREGKFAQTYGRIRVITFMLMFFSIMILVPIMYNFVSIVMFVFLFPFYYAFITELIKVLPSATNKKRKSVNNYFDTLSSPSKSVIKIGREKIKEYLE